MTIDPRIRSEFPIAATHTYLDNAYRGALCKAAITAAQAQIEQIAAEGSLSLPPARESLSRLIEEFAAFINADPGEVVFLGNATEALTRVTLGIDWKEGDEIIAPADDYPGVLRPLADLERRGVSLRMVEPTTGGSVTTQALIDAVSARTRLVVASHVNFRHGYRLNVQELAAGCRSRGVLTAIDFVQSVGAVQLDMHAIGCDFGTFEARKWLCALDALGALYVRGDSLRQLTPYSLGLLSVEAPFDFSRLVQPVAAGAARFRLGASSFVQIAALRGALGLLNKVRIGTIERAVLFLNQELRTWASKTPWAVVGPTWSESERSAIIALRLPKDVSESHLTGVLHENKIVASVRDRVVRISPHFFNDGEDLERLANVLTAASRT